MPPQTGYCERLQPLLDKAVRAARIGTEMACLDVPGVTDLGRYGPAHAGEEESLVNCFDQAVDYDTLLHAPEGTFQLAIHDAFLSDTRAGASASLHHLIPWLPRFEFHADQATMLRAQVRIHQARFVTLVGVATKLQGQARERPCLEGLCNPAYSYVHKALVGIPSVVVTASDASGNKVAIGAPVAGADFSQREAQQGSREMTANRPITLAVARSGFRTAQTERLCNFCGKVGQTCCKSAPACDGGLACMADSCREVGGPGQPCDGDRCAQGATCVNRLCRLECGGKGQVCCGGKDCSGRLRCMADPDAGTEHTVTTQEVEVTGGLLGTDEDQTFGNPSCGRLRARKRFAVTKVGGGRGTCEKSWWFDPKNDKDCRVGVHFSVSILGDIRCRIDVFASAPPKPNVCLP